tara:strand:+ start:445 stop:765 length:321 start_codon:yes stop_codon:yes gene_type:complete
MKPVYYVFIIVLLISKVAYLVSSANLYYIEHKTPNDPTIPLLEKQTKRLLAASTAGIIIALLIDFGYSLLKGEGKIEVDKTEQVIYFISGILGLLHMDWGLIIYNK